jgi:phosphatidylserine decarboxylase
MPLAEFQTPKNWIRLACTWSSSSPLLDAALTNFLAALSPYSLLNVVFFVFCLAQVSPVDGRVLHFGQVKPDGSIEQVKGVKFNVDQFIGPDFDQLREVMKEKAAEFYGKREQQAQEAPSPAKPENKLFFITIYLAPGDYHGVHSPVDWNILEARHFPGTFSLHQPVVWRRA